MAEQAETLGAIKRRRLRRAGGPRLSMRWWLGLAFAAVALITAASVYFFVTDSSERVISERSSEIAVGRTIRVSDRIGTASPASALDLLARNRSEGYASWLFDGRERLLSPRTLSGVSLIEVRERHAAVRRALTGGRYIADQPGHVTLVAAPVFRQGRVDGAVLARAVRPKPLQRSVEKLQGDTLSALLIAILAGTLFGFGVAALIARRLKRLASSAEHMASGVFDIPLQSPWRDEVGDLTMALDSMREALRESFNVLTSERDKLSTIFEGLSDAVMVVGHDGAIRYSNPAAAPLISEDTDGEPRPRHELLPVQRRAVERGHAESDLRLDGHVYAVRAREQPAEQAVLFLVRDRTEELRRELAEREFVSNAAHELRNPIAGISSAIEVLQSGAKDDPEARERFLERLTEDAERLTRITQSLLTLARVEATGEAEGEVADVAAAVQDATDAVPAPDGIELEVDVAGDLVARGDPLLLRQVLVGLLSNAYKNTPEPGTVKVFGRGDGGEGVILQVIDTGVGIAPDELDRVFERFYRAHGSLEQDGFGLGLSIAKRMVDVMGGEIGVASKVGNGSTFWVRLRAAEPSPTPVP